MTPVIWLSFFLGAVGTATLLAGVVVNLRSFARTGRSSTQAFQLQLVGIGVTVEGFAVLAIAAGDRAGPTAVIGGVAFAVIGLGILGLATRVRAGS